ncbi:MAG TPA: DUF1598 domain-containing protein [Pirellulales bacterium]|nr:DUF1598 domain-containing protein [Pirellulales bacterium]
MFLRRPLKASILAMFVGMLLGSAALSRPAAAQNNIVLPPGQNNGGNNNNNNQPGQQGTNGSTTVTSHTNTNISSSNVSGANGVIIDADGVLRKREFSDPTGQLTRDRVQAAKAQLDRRVAAKSKLRKVSLNRLEAAVTAKLEKQQPITDEMLHLAGLTRVSYVFYYPDSKDVVIAGPAEGWASDLSGRVCGVETGRAILELEDLVAALRAFPPTGKKTPVILCSIDPTPEGLAKVQAFIKSVGPLQSPDQADMIVDGLRSSLGYQNIRVEGVPVNCHYAQVLIEADYRMKLIGLGMEPPAVRMASFVDNAHPRTNSNSLQRWYFIPDYQCVRVAADRLGMQLVGNGVKLVDEDEVIHSDGSRKATGKSNKASKQFVSAFTKNYPEIANRTAVYAQLRNCIDLAIAAAFIQQQDFYGKANWQMQVFGNEAAVPIATLNVPARVETVVAAVWKDERLMTPLGGGVQLKPTRALEAKNVQPDEDGKISELRESVAVKDLPVDQWWWD